MGAWGTLSLAVVVCCGMGGGCREEAAPGRPWHQALYAGECLPGFTCYGDVVKDLPLLHRTQTDIYLAVPSWKIGDPGLESLLRKARAAGVGVRAWILLPEEQGYWPNEDNVDNFAQAVTDFVLWSDSEGLGVGWIVTDLEPSLGYTLQFSGLLAGLKISEALSLLRTHIDPMSYRENKAKFGGIISFLHARGWKAMAVTYPMVLDDLSAGTEKLQDALDIPCSGLDWDNASFMVYLTTYQGFVPQQVGPDLVCSYARDAEKYFGEKGGIALGVVGPGGVGGGQALVYTGPAILHRDIGAALAGGIHEIQAYSLEGIAAMGSPEEWLGLFAVSTDKPSPDPATQIVRGLMAGIAAAL